MTDTLLLPQRAIWACRLSDWVLSDRRRVSEVTGGHRHHLRCETSRHLIRWNDQDHGTGFATSDQTYCNTVGGFIDFYNCVLKEKHITFVLSYYSSRLHKLYVSCEGFYAVFCVRNWMRKFMIWINDCFFYEGVGFLLSITVLVLVLCPSWIALMSNTECSTSVSVLLV